LMGGFVRQATVTFRIPQEEKERLEAISAKVHLPKSVLLKEAVREYLDEIEDALIALERLSRDDRNLITGEELRKRLGI